MSRLYCSVLYGLKLIRYTGLESGHTVVKGNGSNCYAVGVLFPSLVMEEFLNRKLKGPLRGTVSQYHSYFVCDFVYIAK